MKRRFLAFIFFIFLFSYPAFSWGPQGHRLVALIARSQLDREVIATIDYYLKGTSWEQAATWMDDVQNNPKYDYMKTWHYVYIERDKTYVPNKDQNLVNKLEYCLRMLQLRPYQTDETMHETLKVLFHLVGDIHQPLHCGYDEDKGGNTVRLYLVMKETTLHKVWDSDIIFNKNMDMWTIAKTLLEIKFTQKNKAELEKTNILGWMNESRALLPSVYNMNGKMIDQKYIDACAPVVDTQLIKAGLRLAAILNKYFK